MNRIIFILFLLETSLTGISQTHTVDREVVRQSFYLRDRWVDTIKNDTTGLQSRSRSLVTAKAIYDFVDGRLQSYAPATGASYWSFSGNTATAGSSYIGTNNNTSLWFKTNGTLRAILDSVGNLGLGGLAGSSLGYTGNGMQIQGSGDTWLRITKASAANFQIGVNSSVYMATTTSSAIRLGTNGTERGNIGSGGNWYAGSGSSVTGLGRLHVRGETNDNTAYALYVDNSDASGSIYSIRNDGLISATNHLLWATDNTKDIGASGTTRPRTIYAGTSVETPSLSVSGLSSGSIPIVGTNGLIGQSSNLFWDATNGRLGLLTNSPNQVFSVANMFTVNATGVVTAQALAIGGPVSLRTAFSNSALLIYNTSNANSAVLALSPVANDATGLGTTVLISPSGNSYINSGDLAIGKTSANSKFDVNGFIEWNGQKRVSTQFNKTSDATLANVTGLSVSVEASKTYYFEATLFTASDVAGGVKFAIGGSATATSIIYEANITNAGATVTPGTARATALATTVGDATAVTAAKVKITGTITVANAGTLTVQFAQNASNGTASSVLVGSNFIVNQIL